MFKDFFFDYIYYRLYKLNVNKDEYQGVPALVVVSGIQTLFIGGVFAFFTRLLYDRGATAIYAKNFSLIGIMILVIMAWINYHKFWNNYTLFENRWKGESSLHKSVKGWCVFLVIVFSFFPFSAIEIFLD